MASNIVSDTIDGAYPVAGVDNDTQGFRDNFTIIKSGLSTAAGEITTLQNSTAKLNAGNDFNGTNINDANFNLATDQYHGIGTVISGQNISLLNGRYQTASLNLPEGTTTINFALADWPARDNLSKITVQLFGNDSPVNVSFSVAAGGTIKYGPGYPRTGGSGAATLSVDSSTDPYIIEFWSYNQGTTVYADDKGQFSA